MSLVKTAAGLALVALTGYLAGNLGALAAGERVIKVQARMFEYQPNRITLKKGEPVVIEFTSLDRVHGFNAAELGVRADVIPGKVARVRLVPQKTGTFSFNCDLFCGERHDTMDGTIIVSD